MTPKQLDSVCLYSPIAALRSPQKSSFTPVNSGFGGFASLALER